MPVVPPQARQSTLNINSLHGGQPEPEEGYTGFPAPIVPHSARMVIDRRYLIEETPAAVRQEMLDLLEKVIDRCRDAGNVVTGVARPPKEPSQERARAGRVVETPDRSALPTGVSGRQHHADE